MPQQVAGNANSWESNDLGGKGEALLWECFVQRGGRRFHERMWKTVPSIAGSMIERVKSRGRENTSTFTSLKKRMKNEVLYPNFGRVWIGGKALWWLFFHPDVSLGLSSKGRRICLAFQICPLICVSDKSIVSCPLTRKRSAEKANSGQEWNSSPERFRAAALNLSRQSLSWAKGCSFHPGTLFHKK